MICWNLIIYPIILYIGNYEVVEVDQWGDKPRIVSIHDVLDSYEGTTSIYRKK